MQLWGLNLTKLKLKNAAKIQMKDDIKAPIYQP